MRYLFQESKLVNIATHIAEQLLSCKSKIPSFQSRLISPQNNMLLTSCKYTPFFHQDMVKERMYLFTKVNSEVLSKIYSIIIFKANNQEDHIGKI